MRFFYDFEFIEDGKTIDPISVGVVAEDGSEYYAVFEEITVNPLHTRIGKREWLMANVVPHLPGNPDRHKTGFRWLQPEHNTFYLDPDSVLVKPGRLIRAELLAFLRKRQSYGEDGVLDMEPGPIELWAYFAAYDHVALAQLLGGPMIHLPEGIPWYTMDLKQELVRLGVRRDDLPAQEGDEHNALADARWNRDVWDYLRTYEDRA